MEKKKNKDKLVSKKKNETVQNKEPEKKPELSRKEAFLKDLKDVINKHNIDYATTIQRSGRPSCSTINNQLNYLLESFAIDHNGDNIIIDSVEILNYIGFSFEK